MNPTLPPADLCQLASELAEPKAMRRGSLAQRTVKCSKPGCACARDPNARHGPYYSLTRAVRGKTQSRFLRPGQAALAREQHAAGHACRTKLEAYWGACERWADEQLEVVPDSGEEAEKKGFPRTSRTKSSRKSKGS